MIIKLKLKEFAPHYLDGQIINYIWKNKEIEIADEELIKILGKIKFMDLTVTNEITSEKGMNYIKLLLKDQE